MKNETMKTVQQLAAWIGARPPLAKDSVRLLETAYQHSVFDTGYSTSTFRALFVLLAVRFRYKNYKGEVADRLAVPVSVFFGTTPYHVTPQWFLAALDLEKGERRDFALADVLEWYTDLDAAKCLQRLTPT